MLFGSALLDDLQSDALLDGRPLLAIGVISLDDGDVLEPGELPMFMANVTVQLATIAGDAISHVTVEMMYVSCPFCGGFRFVSARGHIERTIVTPPQPYDFFDDLVGTQLSQIFDPNDGGLSIYAGGMSPLVIDHVRG